MRAGLVVVAASGRGVNACAHQEAFGHGKRSCTIRSASVQGREHCNTSKRDWGATDLAILAIVRGLLRFPRDGVPMISIAEL